jgi:mRNA interferase RelE/StbE
LAWRLKFRDSALRQLKKIDATWQKRIILYLQQDVMPMSDPRTKGKALTGNKRGLWRYRVADYRIVCEIEDDQLCILTLSIAHRSVVYKD